MGGEGSARRVTRGLGTSWRAAGPSPGRLDRGRSQPDDVLGEGEGRGESRRLDAVEVDEAWDAVDGRPLDDEVRRRLAFCGKLGTDAGVARLKASVSESWVVAADGLVEGAGPRLVKTV